MSFKPRDCSFLNNTKVFLRKSLKYSNIIDLLRIYCYQCNFEIFVKNLLLLQSAKNFWPETSIIFNNNYYKFDAKWFLFSHKYNCHIFQNGAIYWMTFRLSFIRRCQLTHLSAFWTCMPLKVFSSGSISTLKLTILASVVHSILFCVQFIRNSFHRLSFL